LNGQLASLSPASVNFGNVYLGLPAVQTVILSNIGIAPMSGKVVAIIAPGHLDAAVAAISRNWTMLPHPA
jgi:hypothetical protein